MKSRAHDYTSPPQQPRRNGNGQGHAADAVAEREPILRMPLHEASPASLASDLMSDACANEDLHQIPDIVIRRLPIYVRTLKNLSDRDVRSVSSEELAELIGVTAAQIRRDLSYFGKFGKQGKGYDTQFLAQTIGRILRLDRQWPVALVGLGHLGRAIANYRGFTPSSFTIVSLFDRNPRHIGDIVNEMEIQPEDRLIETLKRDNIKIGIIATPKVFAQETAEHMVAGGIEAILNYAPVILKVPDYVTVREIDPVSALQSITYYISEDGVPERV
ncbi:MAG: redox-sensing transcriptional repressor Rex [Thermomicrobiales bacterium]